MRFFFKIQQACIDHRELPYLASSSNIPYLMVTLTCYFLEKKSYILYFDDTLLKVIYSRVALVKPDACLSLYCCPAMAEIMKQIYLDNTLVRYHIQVLFKNRLLLVIIISLSRSTSVNKQKNL